MLCASPSPASPAGSEISVGAPSPPPENKRGEDYFGPLKKLKMIDGRRERSSSPSRSSLEGVKSFSIADILGHDDSSSSTTQNSSHLQSATKIVRPWDHLRGPVPVRPFLPPALLHYEHRLALDYQRQIQEHLNAQAQLLRHMNMNINMNIGMDIIPSESGSDRSSSAASDCCSPEIGTRLSDHHHHHHTQQQSHGNGGNGQKSKPNGTPLDALFQMTNKNFDETQGENDSGNIFLFGQRLKGKII